MKCALAAVGFFNENMQYNQRVMIDTMKNCAGKADVVLFGEAFLQGFYGANFDPDHDAKLAVSQDAPIIAEIAAAAKQYAIAVSFGWIEKAGNCFYSSQMTIAADGAVADVYRRVSPGWKLPCANQQYREGNGFRSFEMLGKRVAVALCGDLWFDENIRQLKQCGPDVVFWPVYTDYNVDRWNTTEKHEYAQQAWHACDKVLYVNSVCIDKKGEDIAKGGAALFDCGTIAAEVPSGKEAILFVEV